MCLCLPFFLVHYEYLFAYLLFCYNTNDQAHLIFSLPSPIPINNMRQSGVLRKMASTHCGMRRILKQRLSPVQFIQKSVQTGIYKDLHQKESTNYNSRNPASKPKFAKYPIEYEILSMNPPIPQPPRVPLKTLRQQKVSLPTDKYVQAYMRRYDAKMRASRIVTPAEEEEYRQRKILGIPMQDPILNTATSSSTSSSSAM